jgi:hypothetical protein
MPTSSRDAVEVEAPHVNMTITMLSGMKVPRSSSAREPCMASLISLS